MRAKDEGLEKRSYRKGQPDVPTKLAGIAQRIFSIVRAGDSSATQKLGEDIGSGMAKATMLGGEGSSDSHGVWDNMRGRGGRGRKR
jgi:hypothetical protein